jgi:hypothetical protein
MPGGDWEIPDPWVVVGGERDRYDERRAPAQVNRLVVPTWRQVNLKLSIPVEVIPPVEGSEV